LYDEKHGEELAAWVRPRTGASLQPHDVKAHCVGAIAHYKVPRYIEIVESFPLTTSGKPQKFIMREEMERRLGLTNKQATA
jgi:fatty-acyl-CoA synthase